MLSENKMDLYQEERKIPKINKTEPNFEDMLTLREKLKHMPHLLPSMPAQKQAQVPIPIKKPRTRLLTPKDEDETIV